mmetsp:Transcript_13409/g.27133  ORF Transcript_13409/g.27133 Transcript_13409/m.27133 type:complete len:211 (-) Transcript_13409:24-656(-)
MLLCYAILVVADALRHRCGRAEVVVRPVAVDLSLHRVHHELHQSFLEVPLEAMERPTLSFDLHICGSVVVTQLELPVDCVTEGFFPLVPCNLVNGLLEEPFSSRLVVIDGTHFALDKVKYLPQAQLRQSLFATDILAKLVENKMEVLLRLPTAAEVNLTLLGARNHHHHLRNLRFALARNLRLVPPAHTRAAYDAAVAHSSVVVCVCVGL